MLVVLLHSGIGDVVAIVSRYFGGVKLGTGGLARAYGGAVQLALDSMPRGERVARTTCAIELAYAQLPAVQQLLPRFEATIARQVFGAAVHLEVAVPTEALATLRTALLDATRGEIRLMIAEASTS
jgi:putative IMPACT (imprinted ancient) family translation regulator